MIGTAAQTVGSSVGHTLCHKLESKIIPAFECPQNRDNLKSLFRDLTDLSVKISIQKIVLLIFFCLFLSFKHNDEKLSSGKRIFPIVCHV